MVYNLSQVMQYLAAELDRYLKDTSRPSGYAGIADPMHLMAESEYNDPNARNRVSLALLHVLPDSNGAREYAIMVFSAFKNYETALSRLSRVQDFFRENDMRNPENAQATFPAETVGNIYFEPMYPDSAELHNIWAVRGGRQYPAVFYRMSVRLL